MDGDEAHEAVEKVYASIFNAGSSCKAKYCQCVAAYLYITFGILRQAKN